MSRFTFALAACALLGAVAPAAAYYKSVGDGYCRDESGRTSPEEYVKAGVSVSASIPHRNPKRSPAHRSLTFFSTQKKAFCSGRLSAAQRARGVAPQTGTTS